MLNHKCLLHLLIHWSLSYSLQLWKEMLSIRIGFCLIKVLMYILTLHDLFCYLSDFAFRCHSFHLAKLSRMEVWGCLSRFRNIPHRVLLNFSRVLCMIRSLFCIFRVSTVHFHKTFSFYLRILMIMILFHHYLEIVLNYLHFSMLFSDRNIC